MPQEEIVGQFRNAQGEAAGAISHTDFLHASGTRDRFSLDLNCPHCGQIGKIAWEENDASHREAGSQRRLLDVSPGFHTEAGRTQSGDPLVVCDVCDAILPD